MLLSFSELGLADWIPHTACSVSLLPLFFCELLASLAAGSSCGQCLPWCGSAAQPVLSSPQLHQSQLELQEVRLSYRQLQGKVEELTEERSLQSSAATSTSLLSEIEQSMEAEELEQEREQVLISPPAGRSGP